MNSFCNNDDINPKKRKIGIVYDNKYDGELMDQNKNSIEEINTDSSIYDNILYLNKHIYNNLFKFYGTNLTANVLNINRISQKESDVTIDVDRMFVDVFSQNSIINQNKMTDQ